MSPTSLKTLSLTLISLAMGHCLLLAGVRRGDVVVGVRERVCISQCSCFTKVGRPVRRSSEQQCGESGLPPPHCLSSSPSSSSPLPRTQIQPLGIPSSPLLLQESSQWFPGQWDLRYRAYFGLSGRFHSPAAPILCSCCYPVGHSHSWILSSPCSNIPELQAPVWPARLPFF